MTNEAVILTLLSVIGCLVGALIIYFVGNTNAMFKLLMEGLRNLNTKLDDHIIDCLKSKGG